MINQRTSWNKGLTKETDDRVLRNAIGTSRGKKGKTSPRKGVTLSKEIRLKISVAKRKNGYIRYGYKTHKILGKAVLEHHLVWKKHNGEISEGHHIHHKNGNKLDNRIENLQCVSISAHTKIHWAQGDIRG